jgi:hypothetical protein
MAGRFRDAQLSQLESHFHWAAAKRGEIKLAEFGGSFSDQLAEQDVSNRGTEELQLFIGSTTARRFV